MPLIQSTASVATNAVIDNIFTGSQWEFLPYNAFLEFGFTADATNGDDLRLDVYSGTDILAESLTPSLLARTPVYPDDFCLNDAAVAGERVKVRARNIAAGGTATLFYALKITPI